MQWNSLRRYFCSIFDYRTNQTQSFDWVRLPNVTVRVVTGIVVLGSKNSVEFSKKSLTLLPQSIVGRLLCRNDVILARYRFLFFLVNSNGF